jgi:16S rRNA (guanine966-N2)-methyltransferase
MSALGGDLTDLRVLDLFAGSGALGLEALSRGAVSVVFVERARGALRTLGANIELLDCHDRVEVVRDDAMAFAERAPEGAFDVVLADPPYGRGYAARLLELFRRHPFAREIWVEHGTNEVVPALPELRSRKYGDTSLSCIPAPRAT